MHSDREGVTHFYPSVNGPARFGRHGLTTNARSNRPAGQRLMGAILASWFVSTTRAIGREVEWLLTPHDSEEEARAFASNAICRGLRVEAGTTPGVEPKIRIGWRAAYHWARLRNDESILGLQRRLAGFAR